MSYEDCIDILQEWADARFLQPPIFVDRGDPAANDFTVVNFTTDGAWHDLDLSAIVPTGASAIAIKCEIKTALINAVVSFRKKTNAQPFNTSIMRSQVANISCNEDLVVIPNADRIIQYLASNVVWTRIRMVVKGWWL